MTQEQQDMARKYALEYLVEEITSLLSLIRTSRITGREEYILKNRLEKLQKDYDELAWVYDELEEVTGEVEKEVIHS